jgi:type I restriction-modification system DNA methylase subunit
MTYSEGSTGITDLKNAISRVQNICRDIEDGYDPLMAVDEITKILFIRLSEERAARDGGTNRFSTETMEQVCQGSTFSEADWLNNLLQENIERSAGTFPYGDDDEVNLSDESVKRIVNVLSNSDLLEEEADVKGVAYEELLNTVFRDTLGQYFTPRAVVKFMVKLINPEIDLDEGKIDKVVDPGVGSGGFLIATLEHYLDTAENATELHQKIPDNFYGIDRSPRMSKVATTNLMLHSEEEWEPFSHIYQGNSLDTDTTKGGIPVNSHNNENGTVPFGEFDKLLANPPFGSKAREELAEGVTDNTSHTTDDDLLEVHRETEALFLKRSVELLRPGGELAIVIPKNIMKGSGHDDLQKWLRKNAIIESVIHLPLSTFKPFGSDVKTVVLHVRKRDEGMSQGGIYFDAARYVGHDATGSEIPENDLEAIIQNYRASRNCEDWESEDPTSKSFGVFVPADEFDSHFDDGGLDPLYYILDNSNINDQIDHGLQEGADKGSYNLHTVRGITTRRTAKINRTDATMAYVIFANDIDRPLGEITSLTIENGGTDDELGNYVICEPGDVIYYRMRPYLRKAAVVPESITLESGEELDLSEVPLACSPEFCVLTVDSEDPEKISGYIDINMMEEYLWLILRSNLTLYQVLPTIKGGTRPRVPFGAIMDLEIPVPERSVQEDAITQYRDLQQEIKEYRKTRQGVINQFKQQNGSKLFGQLGMSAMQNLDDDLISLLIEADILPKSYHSEFY